ncbi:MAG TPA: sigma-70 family RNA polymerase sigma factor [Planctomycetota bacterium]|nr:sigma-70 family RNA polymerase sigma factor [Planctomycetota bacterium]
MSQSSTVEALRSLAGDQAQAGWQALVEHHGPDVWRLILSRSRDANEAEDVYQDFWLGLPRSATSFRPAEGADPERSARAWLMRVAYTTAIDRVRRRRPGTVDASSGAAMDHADPQLARLLVDGHERPGTGELQDRELLLQRVQGALNKLPETYRRPLLLYVVAGLSYEDLAADLRCTVNNARVRVHRSLKRLREMLGGNEASFNERALAGLIVPVMLAVPPAPSLAAALSLGAGSAAASGVAGVGAAGSGATSATAAAMVPVAVAATGVAAAGVALAVVLGGSPAPAAPIVPPAPTAMVRLLDDFDRTDAHIDGHSYVGLPSEIALVPAPTGGGGGSALRLGWTAEHKNWIDCEYRNGYRQMLPGVTATAATVATMQVWAPQTTRLHHVAIRFMDADGEMFEWRHALPEQGTTGWRTVEFPLDPTTSATWDKRPIANRIVDPPIRLLGYAVEMGRDGSKEGVVIIDEVRLREPNEK